MAKKRNKSIFPIILVAIVGVALLGSLTSFFYIDKPADKIITSKPTTSIQQPTTELIEPSDPNLIGTFTYGDISTEDFAALIVEDNKVKILNNDEFDELCMGDPTIVPNLALYYNNPEYELWNKDKYELYWNGTLLYHVSTDQSCFSYRTDGTYDYLTSQPESDDVLELRFKNDVITYKLESSTTNEQSQIVETYSFEMNYEDGLNHNLVIDSIKFSKSSDLDPNEFVNVSVDNIEKIITVTKLQDFSIPIILQLKDDKNDFDFIRITIDCYQRWNGFKSTTQKTFYKNVSELGHLYNSDLENEMFDVMNNGFTDVYSVCFDFNYNYEIERTYVSAFECYSTNLSRNYVISEEDILDSTDSSLSFFKDKIKDLSFHFQDSQASKIAENWSDEKKALISGYTYYGIALTYKATYKFMGKQKTVKIITYLIYETSALGLATNETF